MAKVELHDEDDSDLFFKRTEETATVIRRHYLPNEHGSEHGDDDEEYTTDEEVEANRLSASSALGRWWQRLWQSPLAMSCWRLGSVAATVAWVVTTSLVMTCLPVLYAYDREKNVEAYEAEQQRFTQPTSTAPK